jgi:hypothetical protein
MCKFTFFAHNSHTHSTLLLFWRHSNVAVWAAIIMLFVYTRHWAMASIGNCYVSTTITWIMRRLVFNLLKHLGQSLFTFSCQTGSWYWWHCTVTTTDSTIHCSRCLEKKKKDFCNVLFQYTCEIYWCSETVSRVTPCTMFCFNIHVRYTGVLKLYHVSLHVQYPTVMSTGHIQQHSESQCCVTAIYWYNEYIITATNVWISCTFLTTVYFVTDVFWLLLRSPSVRTV